MGGGRRGGVDSGGGGGTTESCSRIRAGWFGGGCGDAYCAVPPRTLPSWIQEVRQSWFVASVNVVVAGGCFQNDEDEVNVS
jgi:hypothetical protein